MDGPVVVVVVAPSEPLGCRDYRRHRFHPWPIHSKRIHSESLVSLVNHREDKNLRYVGGKLTKAPFVAAIFVFLYTLTPLSTTALFTAAGIARVKPWYILPAFFCGRLITDGVMVYTGKYAAGNVSGLLQGQLSIKSMLTLIAGLLVMGAFLFIDWRCFLEKRRLRFNFRILR